MTFKVQNLPVTSVYCVTEFTICCLVHIVSVTIETFVISWEQLSYSLLITSLSCVIIRHVTALSTYRSFLNLQPSLFCFGALNILDYSRSAKNPPHLITVGVVSLSCEIVHHVNFVSDRPADV